MTTMSKEISSPIDKTPDNSRPSIIAKRTHIRQQKHDTSFPSELPISPRTINRIVIGLGYAGLAGYVYQNFKKLSPWEITGVSAGSLVLGYGLFDLGKRNGMIQGASFALRKGEEEKKRRNSTNNDDWKEEFQGHDFQDLEVADQIAWLEKEDQRIKDVQESEQLQCGKAYIVKEEAYVKYEKFGGYGGRDWKAYADADTMCQTMYKDYQKHQRRLADIRKEINELNTKL